VSAKRDPLWWHLALLVAASVGFESLFLGHGLNVIDEGWPLYAAMRLHGGGTLYQDVFFVFPPGHLLAAWIGYGLDPPGLGVARTIYAAFNVALCVGIYFLGRRLMPASFALLGALLLAFAAPQSHFSQLLFGYRYLVWTVLALLAFGQRLSTGNRRWMVAAGLLTGVALCFRLTPAFAVSLGIGVAMLTLSGGWRSWIRDGSCFALGLIAVVAPLLLWFAASVGLDTLWREVVQRPLEMTALQSQPMPELALPPVWSRLEISEAFIAARFRIPMLLYAGYLGVLVVHWLRSLSRGEAFDRSLLLAVTIWGGVYFLRSLGRSDEPHLDSAIPPVCLLLAHALHSGLHQLESRWQTLAPRRREIGLATGGALLALWIFLLGSDTWLGMKRRGDTPLLATAGQTAIHDWHVFQRIDGKVRSIHEWTRPDEAILDLSAAPLLYVLAERLGPGSRDVVIPGTFRSDAEELAFLERLEQNPPAVVIVPRRPFDQTSERAVQNTAPRVSEWVKQNYERRGDRALYLLLVPKHPAGAESEN
jgi:hypothetical protein